ncbi:protein inscuteable homolog isoform X2 [Odontomachus brunneus]|uniref:protein inscuteable homolog isoform X2 n=1 Tax=Odontomachus brunneus TaxID=486640 RepID=UPI0013F27438|nr:protein inscuteable homolog isoform X2 [Odontomachus brunneus]
MSAFKRYQSRVFWDQMATRDLKDDRFAERNGLPKCDSFEFPPHEKDVEKEDSTGKSENNTVNSGDITAIRVCKSSDEDPKRNACPISSIRDESIARRRMDVEETKEEKREIISRNRSCSPLSQDLKSQDSGFSDSERSDCSQAYENATPRRKSRRRRMRERRIQSTIASPSLEEASPPNPMHTSTPKNSRIFQIARNRLGRWKTRSSSQGRRSIDETQSNAPKTFSVGSLEGECLGDFLYTSEPPEDSVQPAKSPVSTDSTDDAITAGRDVLKSRNYRQSSSMRAWLTDLATETENECSNALQSKNLPRRRALVVSGEAHARDLKMMSSAATAAASKLLANAEQFEQHYRNIIEKITRLEGGRSEMALLRSIEEAAFAILSQLGAPPPRRIQQGSLRSVLAQLQNMKTYVDGTIDTRLDFYIEKIVRGLEEAPREDSGITRGALAALTALGLSDSRAGSSIARCSGIKALLTCLISVGPRDPLSSGDLIAVSLRALASICSSTTAIEYFVRDGGPEILTDLLEAESTREKEKTEATALVVQITAPWTNAIGLPYLEPFAASLIPALNHLLENTGCAQTLLLTAAALNNLSKSQLCTDVILGEDSVRKLLRSVKKSAAGGNVWLMEQVAALIGELARTPAGRAHLAKVRASVALVSFLRMRPPGLEDAYRRLEVTAAAALTRLCVDPEIARQVVAVGGGDFLPVCDFDKRAETEEDEPQVETGLLRYTRSLRRACRKAAKQIGIAKAKDRSTLD